MSVRYQVRRLLMVPAMLVVILVVIAVVRAGQYTFHWWVYSEERVQLEGLRERVVDAGAAVVRIRMRADTLRASIDRADRRISTLRRTLDQYGQYADNGALAPHLYESYRADLDAFNALVQKRNRRVEEWNALVTRSGEAMRRYESVVDSIRALAARIGDPYYPVPLPIEAAVERGVIDLTDSGERP